MPAPQATDRKVHVPTPLDAAVEEVRRTGGWFRKIAKAHGVAEADLRAACKQKPGEPHSSPRGRKPSPPPAPAPQPEKALGRADLTRLDFLELEVAELSEDIDRTRADGKAHTVAYRQLRKDLAERHAELSELRAEAKRQADLAERSRLSALGPEERRARLRDSAHDLPEDVLQVLVEVWLRRHAGRVEVIVAGEPWTPPWDAA